MSKKCILLIGGARSGKSRFAQELARESGGSVLFVATAEAGDDEMRIRIEDHKRERPSGWSTLEVAVSVGGRIRSEIGSNRLVIVDCITLLVNNIFNEYCPKTEETIDASLMEKQVLGEIGGLIECMRTAEAGFIVVTNEVGLGLVPADKMSRLYRDLLGKANQMLAEYADEVYLMVAGLPVPVKPLK